MKKALADALEKRGYDTLTPVQQAVTDPALSGADLLVSAQTGSGKTLAFGLAIAPTLLDEAEAFDAASAPLALVIAPTRELAMQVKRELSWLFAQAGAHLASCVGGMDMRDERRALTRGAHIVVATPGRLRDHIMRGSINLSDIRAVILDEADEMLDLGFREDLEFILGEAPDTRQTLMFSATVPRAIADLAKNYQKGAHRIETKSETSQHADIDYRAMLVADRDAENAIINTLRYYEAPNAIVFANTRAMVNRLTTRLSNRGFSVVALSGELSQSERTHALQAMRDGRARVCVATDVAARGIDLPNLDLVVHAELPGSHETLLHRSGRTGRAGRKGVSALVVTPKTRSKAQRILKWAKLTADWGDAPSADDVRARDEVRMLGDASWQDPVTEAEQDAVAKLTAQFNLDQIAAAYLRLFHSQHSAPEEISAAPTRPEKPKPREAFGPSVWFSVAGGRATNAEPRRLLPMLCKLGNITKEDIGAIRIQQDQSYVEIRQSAADAFQATIGDDMQVEGARLERLTSAPDLGAAPKPSFDKPKRPKPHRKPEGTTKPVDWNDDPAPRQRKPKPADRKTDKKPRHKAKRPEDSRPEGVVVPKRKSDAPKGGPKSAPKGAAKKPGGPKPPPGKPSSKKNRARAAAAKAVKPGGNAPPKRRKP